MTRRTAINGCASFFCLLVRWSLISPTFQRFGGLCLPFQNGGLYNPLWFWILVGSCVVSSFTKKGLCNQQQQCKHSYEDVSSQMKVFTTVVSSLHL